MTTININLLPEELRPVSGSSGSGGGLPEKEVLIPIGAGLLAAIVIAVAPGIYVSTMVEPHAAELALKGEELDQEINKYNTSLNSLKAIADNKEMLRQQLATLQSVASGGGPGLADMLNELRALTPANLWFDGLTTDAGKGTMQLTGAALDYSLASVSALDEALEAAHLGTLALTPMQTVGAAAYLYEVARRAYGGLYEVCDDEDPVVLVCGEPEAEVCFCAIAKVERRIRYGASEAIPPYFELFRAAMEEGQAQTIR